MSNRNLITDVAGVRVGHAGDARLGSGATVVLFDQPTVTAADLRGGAPGTRESALLGPAMMIERVDAIALSGGSAFGLDTASGAKAWLAEQGRGFAVRTARVPVVPGAILFDLLNGGDKAWGRYAPYRELGYQATIAAAAEFALGSAGAGLGATTAGLKGGLGSASATASGGITVGALAAVNAIGSAVIGDGPHFWAAPFERNGEFGGRGLPSPMPRNALAVRTKGQALENTTLVVVATDALLTKEQTQRLAMMAQDGLARALRPIHTPFDGDVVYAAATGALALTDPMQALVEIGTVAADVVARAIARAVYEAHALPFPGALPSWKDKFGS